MPAPEDNISADATVSAPADHSVPALTAEEVNDCAAFETTQFERMWGHLIDERRIFEPVSFENVDNRLHYAIIDRLAQSSDGGSPLYAETQDEKHADMVAMALNIVFGSPRTAYRDPCRVPEEGYGGFPRRDHGFPTGESQDATGACRRSNGAHGGEN
jgi:hypothetical protein